MSERLWSRVNGTAQIRGTRPILAAGKRSGRRRRFRDFDYRRDGDVSLLPDKKASLSRVCFVSPSVSCCQHIPSTHARWLRLRCQLFIVASTSRIILSPNEPTFWLLCSVVPPLSATPFFRASWPGAAVVSCSVHLPVLRNTRSSGSVAPAMTSLGSESVLWRRTCEKVIQCFSVN